MRCCAIQANGRHCHVTALQDRLATTAATEWSPERRRRIAALILAPVANYPDQVEVCRGIVAGDENQAIHGTRRSGKTDVIMRVLLALLVVRDGFIVRMLTNVLVTPTRNVLARISDGGVLQILRRHGMLGTVCRISRGGPERAITGLIFDWGSAWTIHHIAHAAAIDNIHGFEGGDIVWIDEATKTPMMEYALRNLVNPTLADQGAIKVLSYTPDEEVDGMAARLARQGEAHWQSHHLRQWRNPFYGSTFAERWQRIVHRVIELSHLEYGLSDDDVARLQGLSEAECDAIARSEESAALLKWVDTLDPELLRNLFGRWTDAGARHVYPWHKIPETELYWCALGPLSSRGGLLPVAATLAARVALLPQLPSGMRARRWEVSLACDLGTVDAWAGVALAWSRTYPRVLELDSRKAVGLDDDEMFEAMAEMISDLAALPGVQLTSILGDLSGMRQGTQRAWNRRLRRRFPRLAKIGISAARKREKLPRIRQHWLDMMQRRLAILAGSELDTEGRHLRYKPQRPGKPPEVDKQREVHLPGGHVEKPGDHACDAMLYAFDVIPILECREPDVQRERLPDYFTRPRY